MNFKYELQIQTTTMIMSTIPMYISVAIKNSVPSSALDFKSGTHLSSAPSARSFLSLQSLSCLLTYMLIQHALVDLLTAPT